MLKLKETLEITLSGFAMASFLDLIIFNEVSFLNELLY